jgi:hypothetical protein
MMMKVKSITAVVAMLALLGAGSAFARSNNLVEGQEVTGKAEPAFTSTLSRTQVQDEAIKAAQDGTLAVNVSKILTIEGQPVAGVTTASDVGSSSISRAQVQEELVASRTKESGMPKEAFDYL